MKGVHLIGKEKKINVEVAKIYIKNESSMCEIVKREKEICAGFAVTLQSAEVTDSVS